MNKNELLQLHLQLSEDARVLMEKKNADYAHGNDPFRNFRASEVRGVPPAKGIIIRIDDKLQRFVSFIERGDLKVSDESLRDSVIDVINYVVLLYGLLAEQLEEQEILLEDLIRHDVLPRDSNDLKMIYDPSDVLERLRYEERQAPDGSTWNKEIQDNERERMRIQYANNVKLGEEDNV